MRLGPLSVHTYHNLLCIPPTQDYYSGCIRYATVNLKTAFPLSPLQSRSLQPALSALRRRLSAFTPSCLFYSPSTRRGYISIHPPPRP